MKKKYFIWLLVGFLGLNCSCSDWLDVNPRTEMKEEDMYQSEKGFKNVMNGIYIQVASEIFMVKYELLFPRFISRILVQNE